MEHEDELRRNLLTKQHLARGERSCDPLTVVDDLVGLHATGSTSPYLQLLARVPGFSRADLDRALYEDRTLARVRCMRRTVFVVTKALLRTVMPATKRLVEPFSTRYLSAGGVTEREYQQIARRIEQLLGSTDEALTVAALRERVGAGQSLSRVVNLMCDQGRLIRDRPVGTWKSRSFTYRRFPDVFPDVTTVAESDAVRRLVESYVRAYGPVSWNDLAWWTGLGRQRLRDALDAAGDAILPIEVEAHSSRCLVHAEDLAAAASRPRAGNTLPSVCLLPELDPYLMGRHDRRMLLDPELIDYVTDRAGNVTSTVVVDGRVAGVWDIAENPSPVVRFHLFDSSRSVLSELQHRASAIGRFWFGMQVPVREVARMSPLTHRSAGGFLSPLANANGRCGQR